MRNNLLVFKRKIYDEMLHWKRERNGETALLIKGARRVGKSTIAEEFAKREYDSYIAIDFADAKDSVWEAVKHICVSSGYDNCRNTQSLSKARYNSKARLWKGV